MGTVAASAPHYTQTGALTSTHPNSAAVKMHSSDVTDEGTKLIETHFREGTIDESN